MGTGLGKRGTANQLNDCLNHDENLVLFTFDVSAEAACHDA